MTTSIFARMLALLADAEPFAVSTVVRTKGSTPQVVGARLVVCDDVRSRPIGTLGGGCVEADALEAARDVLRGGQRSIREYRLTEDLAWNTGLVCGGTMWILTERGDAAFPHADPSFCAAAARALEGGAAIVLATRLAREGRRVTFAGRIAVSERGPTVGSFGDVDLDTHIAAIGRNNLGRPPHLVALDDVHDVLVEPLTAPPHLVIAGGGHVAQAIARLARQLEFVVTVLEDRPEFADPGRFDGARVIGGEIVKSIADVEYGPGSFLVIATRGHKLDAACVLAAARTAVPYIGLLGSKRKTVLVERMLSEEGTNPARIAVLHAPVGLDLGGRTPPEIALSVMAEIVQTRCGGSGRPLGRERRGV